MRVERMNVLLWVVQVALAALMAMGSYSQLFAFDRISRLYAPYRALPQAFWVAYAMLGLACALGLLMTRVSPRITAVAASILTAQCLAFSAIYAHFAGLQPSAAMWAAWTLGPAAAAAFVAWGRWAQPIVRNAVSLRA